MRRKLFTTQSELDWIFDQFGFNWIFQVLEHSSEDERAMFCELFYDYERMLDAHSGVEFAQKVLEADSPVDAAFKLLQTSSEGRELLRNGN